MRFIATFSLILVLSFIRAYSQCPTSGTISSDCTSTDLTISGNTLNVNSGVTVTVTGTLTINNGGTINGTGATFNVGTLRTTYGSPNDISGGNYSITSFSGGSNTNITNVTMTSTGAFTSGYGIFNYTNSTINIGGLFSVGSNANNVDNCTINSGTGNAGTNDATALTMNGGGSLTLINDSQMNVRGSVVNNEWYIDDSDVIVTGDFDNAGSEILEVRNNGTINVQGNFNNSGSGNVSADDGGLVQVGGDYNNSGGGSTDVDGGTFVVGGTYSGNDATGDAGDCNGGSGGCCGSGCGSLPVTFIDFNTSIERSKVVLTWSTETELNNDFFTLERSYDGINFHEIAIIPGAGTSNHIREYSFVDRLSLDGQIIYYSLSQTDYDGTHTNLKVSFAKLSQIQNQVKVYPNPLKKDNRLHIQGVSVNSTWVIYSLSGQSIMNGILSSNSSIDSQNIPAGTYLLVFNEDASNVKRIVIK